MWPFTAKGLLAITVVEANNLIHILDVVFVTFLLGSNNHTPGVIGVSDLTLLLFIHPLHPATHVTH